ncbi:DUF362 domain-containing protein [Acidobacteriota bacterium]
MPDKEKVLIRSIPHYDPSRIRDLIKDGIQELGLDTLIRGRITIKPNVVMAHHIVAPSAYTRSEFMDGLISALQETGQPDQEITIAEKCGAGIPTSRMFRRAGYNRFKKSHRIKLVPIEEAKKKTIPLEKGKIHKKLTTARVIAENDFLVYAPKLKSNVLSQGLTGSIKLNVGILLDRERMWQHNFNLEEKIVDLLEVGLPDLIVTDGIEMSYGGNQLTQHGFPTGIIVMASNPVAHDTVCAQILNLIPQEIRHIRLAHERGYGPIAMEDIDLISDVPLEELQSRTSGLDLGYRNVRDVDCNLKILNGSPYCTGGCHGVFLDWLYMIKDRKPHLWKKMPEWTVVIGKYDGDVEAKRIIKIGTCTKIKGKLKTKRKIHIKGCPPRHKDFVLFLFLKAGIINPLFRLDLILDSYLFLFLSWCRRLLRGRL